MKLRRLHLGLLAFVIMLVLAGWQLYDVGKLRGAIELAQLRTENYALGQVIRKTTRENKEMLEKLAILERSSQIDQQAALAVKSELGQLESELQAAREEVEFFRGIVAPGNVSPGLRIHRFELEPGQAPGEFHYDLVLTHLKHNDQLVSGVVDWKIAGTLEGLPVEFELAGVSDPKVKRLKFRFRYFQDLAGVIRLPAGFLADHVELTVRPEGNDKQSPVVQKFNWPLANAN